MSDKLPTLLTVDSHLSGVRFSRRVYLPRITGTLLCSLFIASVLVTKTTPFWVWMLLFLNAFVWPHLAYYFSRRSIDPMRFERGNLLADVVFGGFWIGMMGLNVLPSVIIIAMVGMNSMAGGGIRLFIQGVSLQLLSAALVAGLNAHRIDLVTTPTQLYACLPMLVIIRLRLGM
ncbi:MAG: MASE2 domain-containing protein [Symbiopectobacterium sp.]|uniref:MASE2 domain-containing protein n=1 Tax=Symbiopectobacterium sp. TaxID=2952789 RepID=UPI0039E8ED1F